MTKQHTQGDEMSGTFCTEGFIPHLLVEYEGGTFLAPVKLRRKESGQPGLVLDKWDSSKSMYLPEAVKVGNCYAYALPGGCETYA